MSFRSKASIATLLICVSLAGAPARRNPRPKPKPKPAPAVRTWVRTMTLRDKVAQLVFVSFYGEAPNTRSQEYQKYLRWVRTLHVGGMVLVNRVRNGQVTHAEPYAMATFLNRMQRLSHLPLLVAGDFERGDSMRVASETKFPHAMAFAATGDPGLSRIEGLITARQARALGVPWILAPVVDVNNNPDNPIISIRSFGENPEVVEAHTRAFIEGAHSAPTGPVLVTAKHFPGHGDASTDTHMALAVLNVDRARLDSVEFPPFRTSIAAGIDSVMTAHLAVPALDGPEVPATLSRAMLTGVLRDEMGFKGLIVTDALDMNGVSKFGTVGQVAVRAIEAGADVLLMPSNPEQAVEAVARAVQSGAISKQRIDDSLTRVLAAKVRLGLNQRRLVDADAAMDELDTPEDLAHVQQIADRAVTLVTNQDSLVPLTNPSTCFAVLPESRYGSQGKVFTAEVKKRSADAQILTLDPAASEADFDKTAESLKSCEVTVVAAFASVAAYRGSAALAGGYPKFVTGLIEGGRPVVFVALGNPYVIRSFAGARASLTTYSTVPASEIAAVKALYHEIPIEGHLPVTIPGVAKYGEGIQIAK